MASVLHTSVFQNLLKRSGSNIKFVIFQRHCCGTGKKGAVIGAFTENDGKMKLTNTGQKLNGICGGKILELMGERKHYPLGATTLLENLDCEFDSIVVAGAGNEAASYNSLELLHEERENVRVAVARGIRAIQRQHVKLIDVDTMGHGEAAGESAALTIWRYQEHKSKEHHAVIPEIRSLLGENEDEWQRGVAKGECQNIARYLSDAPANLMTPSLFAHHAAEILCPCGIGIEVRTKEWIEKKGMSAFLSVSKGSCEAPLLMELTYGGGDSKPIVMVGEGITFNAGGICLQSCPNLIEKRGTKAGGAVIVGLLKGLALLNVPVSVKALIPLCENVPSGMAMRPGDIVGTMKGKTIKVENTNHAGRLVLSDTLTLAGSLSPRLLIDVATISTGVRSALGGSSVGGFATTDNFWEMMIKAGSISGDRVWRFPLWRYFKGKVSELRSADLTNQGLGVGGGPCLAAAFLREFVDTGDWIHLDISSAGMLEHTDNIPYLARHRMTGRPTRTLIEFCILAGGC